MEIIILLLKLTLFPGLALSGPLRHVLSLAVGGQQKNAMCSCKSSTWAPLACTSWAADFFIKLATRKKVLHCVHIHYLTCEAYAN